MALIDFRRGAGSTSQKEWRRDEMTELMRLCLKVTYGAAAEAYAYGETEHLDPQFYVVTSDPALPSVICVSRISQNGRRWYIVQNGRGSLLGEGGDLAALIDAVTDQIRSLSLPARLKALKPRHPLLAFFRSLCLAAHPNIEAPPLRSRLTTNP